jgi:hypothetical protein
MVVVAASGLIPYASRVEDASRRNQLHLHQEEEPFGGGTGVGAWAGVLLIGRPLDAVAWRRPVASSLAAS